MSLINADKQPLQDADQQRKRLEEILAHWEQRGLPMLLVLGALLLGMTQR